MLEQRYLSAHSFNTRFWGRQNDPWNGPYFSSAIFTGLAQRSGSSNPGWRDQIMKMQNATTAFSGVNYAFVVSEPFDWMVSKETSPHQLNRERAFGVLSYPSPSDPASLSEVEANTQAQRRAVAAIRNQMSLFQGGTVVAEIRDTIRGILHPLKSLREGLSSYHRTAKKRIRNVRPTKLQDVLASTWLEFQYGWLPLSSDIDNGLANLREMSKPRALAFRASGSDGSYFMDSTEAIEVPGLATLHKTKVQHTALVTVSYYGAFKVSPPRNWDSESWGLSTRDFVPAVWEAIPYSFAIDYFSNIGDIINAYSYLPNNLAWLAKTVRKSQTSVKVGTRLDTSSFAPPSVKIQVSSGGLGASGVARTSVQRSFATQFDLIPRFTLRIPGAGSTKWLNLAALFHLRTL